MKMVCLDGEALNPGDLSWAPLEAFGSLTVYPRTENEALAISRVGDAEVIFVNKYPVTATLLDACPGIRLIIVLATGYNVVDCAAARERNIPVCNIPAYGTAAVAQFTFALILELVNRVGIHDISVHNGDWTRCPDFSYWLTTQTELVGKTLGILGLGRIGKAVANIARGFGMNVISYSRCQEANSPAEYVTLDDLFARSDILTLHCPLFPETEKLINRNSIAKMKDGAILINNSRGGLIDEQDVTDALNCGKLRAAAVDVVSTEPIVGSNPLLTAKNCIITPHMSWAAVEARARIVEITAGNIRAYLNGGSQNVVNP